MLPITSCIEIARGRSPRSTRAASPARYGDPVDAPPVVVWNITRRCNQRCRHCYASAGPSAADGELSTARCLEILGEMGDVGVPIVIFSGGEPLMRPDLIDLVDHAASLGIRPQVSSNGTQLDDERARALKLAGVRYLGVSIDGPEDFNDPFRGMPQGRRRAVEGLRAASRAGIRTGLRCTLTAENEGVAPDLFDLAEAVGASRFYTSHLVQVGRASRGVPALSPSRSRRSLAGLFELALGRLDAGSTVQLVTGGNDSAGPLLLAWLRARFDPPAVAPVEALLRSRGGNSAGVRLLDIGPTGDVHPDPFWTAAVLGNLREGRFAEVLRHPLRAQLRDRARFLRGRCGSCALVDLCGGSHRERALALCGDPWQSDPACVMTDREVTPRPPAAQEIWA